jgi:microcystin-dependent protein
LGVSGDTTSGATTINDITTINGATTVNNTVTIKDSLKVGNVVTAEVNGVENVYLGCPIGTIVMWAGNTAPDGWFLCDGTPIPVNELETGYKTLSCKIHSKEFSEGELNFFAFEILSINGNSNFGNATLKRYNNRWVSSGDWVNNNTGFEVTTWTDDCRYAYKFYSDKQIYFNRQNITAKIEDYYSILMPDLQQKFPLGAVPGKIGSDPDGNGYATDLGKIGGEDMHILTPNEMPEHNHTFNVQSWGYSTAGNDRVLTNNNDKGTNEEISASTGYPSISNTGGNQSHNNIPPFLAINFIIKYK